MIVALYSYTCQSGKDTCAGFIEHWARMEYRSFSKSAFANPMKIVCADALGLTGTDDEKIAAIDRMKLHGRVQTMVPMVKDDISAIHNVQKGRDFIIGLAGDTAGTYGVRRWQQDFWIQAAQPEDADIQVITDLRFLPEAEWVINEGGKIIEIVRPDTIHKNEDRLPPEWLSATVHNVGSLKDLEHRMFGVMDHLFPARAASF